MENYPSNSSSSLKPDRKTIEKNRRNQMKNLFTQLNSLVPHQNASSSRENMSMPEQLDEATKYIKRLQAHLERLKEKKSNLRGSNTHHMPSRSMESSSDCGASASKSPQIEVNLTGDSALQVVLITGPDCQFIFTEAIRVLHDEGVEVVNASFSVMEDTTVLHTIHAKIVECSQSQVIVARITERLNRFCIDP